MTLESRNKFVIQKVLQSDITQEDQVFFPLWNEKTLLTMKSDFLLIIKELRNEQYTEALKVIDGISEFNIQKTEYISWAEDQFKDYAIKTSTILQVAGEKGATYQEVINTKAGFSTEINQPSVKNWADLHAGELITGINETTRKRINKLIVKALDEWMSKQELKEILKTDFWFWEYRANLIVRNELKKAYTQWKKIQFAQWQKHSWMRGWKDWISQDDDRVTELCFLNDKAGTIPFDKEFPSWDMEPPRFPWCRCSIAYLPFSEEELWEVDDIKEHEDLFIDNKPDNYDELSAKVVPAIFFKSLGSISYTNKIGAPYFDPNTSILNLGHTQWIKKKYAEVHELGHAFYYARMQGNKDLIKKYVALQELLEEEIYANIETIQTYFPQQKHNAFELFQLEEIFKHPKYFALEKHSNLWGKVFLTPKYTERYKRDYHVIADLIGAMTKGKYGAWHPITYYTEQWYDEIMPAINTVHFFDNKILEVLLPKSYTAMRNFYFDIGLEF